MATRKTTAKPKTEEKSEAITLEQALKEEGEGRTPETIKSEGKKTDGPSKMDQATKIMEEMWDDIQAGKVKRKDVIQRFMEEVNLSKAGSSTYYGTIKSRLMKTDQLTTPVYRLTINKRGGCDRPFFFAQQNNKRAA